MTSALRGKPKRGSVSKISPEERLKDILDELTSLTNQVTSLTDEATNLTIPPHSRTRDKIRKRLENEVERLNLLTGRLDPVLKPLSLFDPGDPQTSAQVIGLMTVAQPRHPLATIRPFYGAGVYALYYRGPFEPYEGLAGKEQPIYVGKADPADRNATDAVQQGQALFKRLNEHARSIRAASSTLDAKDFDCRFLIVQSGYQHAAETRLIDFFRPIWNNEVGICFGIGKHGDSSKTRSNKRSPWDTLHPGRNWAEDSHGDQKPRDQILREIKEHLSQNPPRLSEDEVVDAFISDLRQIEPSKFYDASGENQEMDIPGDRMPASDQVNASGTLF
ncbi:Eco29kI family restriction endonuclease [Saccharopolyspora shandongensis]|uniref:Eco29kI family restriction endonuclease n=1 Tax=Saccharopolyspora shandongensis TaxID=418495 RepID=UPI00340B7445